MCVLCIWRLDLFNQNNMMYKTDSSFNVEQKYLSSNDGNAAYNRCFFTKDTQEYTIISGTNRIIKIKYRTPLQTHSPPLQTHSHSATNTLSLCYKHTLTLLQSHSHSATNTLTLLQTHSHSATSTNTLSLCYKHTLILLHVQTHSHSAKARDLAFLRQECQRKSPLWVRAISTGDRTVKESL